MAVAIADVAGQSLNSPASPYTVNYPATAVAGDLIVIISVRADATSTRLWNDPAGWTAIDSQLAGGNATRLQSWWKVSAGESSVAFSYNNALAPAGSNFVVYRITEAHPSVPIDSHTAHSIAAGNPYVANSISVVGQEAVLLTIFGRASSTGTWTPDALQTEDYEGAAGGGQTCRIGANHETLLRPSGATGTRTATNTGGTGVGGVATMIAIAPLPGGKMLFVGRNRWGRIGTYPSQYR